MKPKHYQDAKGLVAYSGFSDTLVDSVILYDELRNVNAIPDRDKGKEGQIYSKHGVKILPTTSTLITMRQVLEN